MSMPLSFYVLTYNSEKHLQAILERIQTIADEIIIVDSGSTDQTRSICLAYTDNFLVRPFDNFAAQRTFAIDNCSHDWILCLDSDEVPSQDLIDTLSNLKQTNFHTDRLVEAYRIARYWYVKQKPVHSIYPVNSPDYPIRLFHKGKGGFFASTLVHETLDGFTRIETLQGGHISHHTFEDSNEVNTKLERYTDLAAHDAKRQGKTGSYPKALMHAASAFVKWYLFRKAFKDGWLGLYNGCYAFRYTYLKYIKLMNLDRSEQL